MVRFDKVTSDRGAQYVDDRRGAGGGGGRRRAVAGRGGAVGGGFGLILLIIGALFGIPALSGGAGGLGLETTGTFDAGQIDAPAGPTGIDPDAELVEFMEALMFDVQDTWDQYFDQAGLTYEFSTLVIFEDVVDSGCGRATSAVGPFYCPAPDDQSVYLDLDFFDDLARRFGAPGDFAQAYVIAHEIGHHVQTITGISDQVRAAQAQDPANRNAYTILQELQADCLAGVWGFSANQRLTVETGVPIIERGDIAEGIAAAQAVGDDRIQEQAGLEITPETWTHGSAEQRVRWFEIGLDTGDPEACDPFSVDNP